MDFILVAETDMDFAERTSAHLQNQGYNVLVVDQLWKLCDQFVTLPREIWLVLFSENFWAREKMISETILDALDGLINDGLARDPELIFRPLGLSIPKPVEKKTELIWRPPYDLDRLVKLVLEAKVSSGLPSLR